VALGIDPDTRGSFCAVTPKGDLIGCLRFHRRYKNEDLFLFDHPLGLRLFQQILYAWIPRCALVAIEHVGARPGEGVCSVFKFGKALGQLLGFVQSSMAEHLRDFQTLRHVAPRTWQATFGLRGGAKAETRDAARLRWPTFAWPSHNRKPDTRISDGAFIAAWGAQSIPREMK